MSSGECLSGQDIAGAPGSGPPRPAFAADLWAYRGCFKPHRAAGHFGTSCRRLLSDLPRKTVEPIARAAGTVGVIVIDETSQDGGQDLGVRRQYLGCVGKADNGVVTVHVGLARGDFRVLLDAELYLSKSWADDRRRAAGHPESGA